MYVFFIFKFQYIYVYLYKISIFDRCNELGLIERCLKIEGRLATNNELLTKHSQEMIDILKSTDDSYDNDVLETLSSKFDAVYFHPVCIFSIKTVSFIFTKCCAIY